MNWTRAAIGLMALVLVGCASGAKNKSPIPEGGPKMLDIYRGATADDVAGKPRPQEEVEALCDELNGKSATRDCIRKAEAKGLVVDEVDSLSASAPGVRPASEQADPLYEDYTRTSANEIKVLFPRLPNPDISLFIYPHLATKNEVPIPGYATVIPLYGQVEYALPGESLTRTK